MQLLGKIMGDPNKRDLKAIQPLIDKINALEPAIQALSDEALAAKTEEFRSQLYLHLKGGLVLENELVKLFREALKTVDTYAQKCTDEQLHSALTEYRQELERRRDLEHYLRDSLQDVLSEGFETAYEKLLPALVALRVTATMDHAGERHESPHQPKERDQATRGLAKESE